jgi:putative MATE family efflux protein
MMDMTKGGTAKQILLFTIPMFIGSVFQQCYNLVDSIIVGKFLGKGALAAVGASFPIMFLLIALTMGATMGITVMISQFYGAKNYEKVKICIETSYIFLVITALGLTVIGFLFSEHILVFLRTPAEVIGDAKVFINVIFSGLIFLFGYNSISAILRGLGDSRTPLYLLIFSVFVNIVLDLLFIVVFKWGIWSAAFATVIAQGVAFFGGIIYLQRINPLFKVNYFKLRFDREIFKESLMIGLPSGVQQMLVAAGMMALTRIVNLFGTDALAAFTAAGRIDSFAMMPAMNLSMAISTFVGQNIGAGKHERVRSAMKTIILMSVVISLIISFIVIVFSKPLLGLFTNDAAVIAIGQHYLFIVGGFYLAFMLMFIFHGALRGAGDTIIPMFITLFSLWIIRIPVSSFLSTKIGTDGIWWGIPIAWVIGAVFSGIYFSTGRWKKKVVINKWKTKPVGAEEILEEIEFTELERKECRP